MWLFRSWTKTWGRHIFGYLWALVGVGVITPLVVYVDRFAGTQSSALLYLGTTALIYYRLGIGPAVFSFIAASGATSYFLMDPKGTLWPIFRTDDQLYLAVMALMTVCATGAISLIRRSTTEAAKLAAKAAELASTTTTLDGDLQRRIHENDELKAELHRVKTELTELREDHLTAQADNAETRASLEMMHKLAESVAWFPINTASDRVLEGLIDYLGADLGSVWTYSYEGSSISLIAQSGYMEGLLRPREILYIPYDGLLHKILGSGVPFCGVPDSSGPFLRLTYASGVKSLAVVPLRYEDAITGFLSVGSREQEGFKPDMRILKTAANLLALSMKIAQQKINIDIWREVA